MAVARAPVESMMQNAREFITRCKTVLNWEDLSEDTVMDIGCGVFFYCTRAILEEFPKIGCLLAIDKNSDVMTKEALEDETLESLFRHAILQFHAVDILDSFNLEGYRNLVDKIVCRDTLQQIYTKEAALQNIFNILRPGGHAGIKFCLSNPVGVWQSMIQSSVNWRRYGKDVPLFFFPGNLENDYYKDMLENIGFQVVLCERNNVPLQFINDESCLRQLLPIGRAILDIPQDKMSEFKQESVKMFKDLIGYKGSGPMTYVASELLILAIKPLQSQD